MNRRELFKLLSAGLVGHALDIDKLLWIPGQKTIFLPSIHKVTLNDIIAIELERVLPQIRMLFERDNTFYTLLEKKIIPAVSSRQMRIPLIIEPGKDWNK